MNNQIINIEYSKVESYNNELHQIALNIKKIFEEIEMKSEIIKKVDNWNGIGQAYYVTKLDEIMSNFQEIYKELENCVIYIAACSEGYQVLDQKVIDDILSNLNLSEISLNTSSIFINNG